MSRDESAAANELCPECGLPVLSGDVDERDPSWVCHCRRGASAAAYPWRNVPAKPLAQTSAGICGMHGSFVGVSCPKCVTQPKVMT